MKNLFVFGCSFSQPYFEWYEPNNKDSAYNLYKKYNDGVFPLTWSELLAKKTNRRLKNYAKGGSCNYRIIKKFNDQCHEIKEGDMVIFQWTHNTRFWLAENNQLMEVTTPDQCEGRQDFDKFQLQKNLIHREKRPWVEEIYSYMNLINQMARLGKFDVFYWSADNNIINGEDQDFKANPQYLLTFATYGVIDYLNHLYDSKITIAGETNGQINDGHFGKRGHEILTDYIYTDLSNRNFV